MKGLIKPFVTITFLLWSVVVFAQERAIRVGCVGNSITYGFGIEDRENDSYPAQLQRMLGEGYTVENFGKSRSTLLSRGHFPYVEQPEYKAALEFAPDIAVIHLGVNDTDPRNWPAYGDRFVREYVDLIGSFRKANPDVRVIIARLSPLTAAHWRFKSGTRDWRERIQEAIEQVARAAGAEVIDFSAALRDRQNLIPDAVHPNAEGAAILARTVYGAITGDYGGLQMPEIYGSGMVLQRYKPLRIRGRADAGKVVTVTLDGWNTASATTDNRGDWSVELAPMAEGTGFEMTVTDGDKKLVYSDIAIGEVWIASGQSNMAFELQEAVTAAADIPQANDGELRFFDMKPRYRTDAIRWDDEACDRVDWLDYYLPASWQPSTPETARRMSAVAYYFGRMLRDSLNVPVGIVHNAIGGSGTEAWVDVETLEHGLPEVLLQWRKNDYVQPWAQQRAAQNTGDRRHPYEPSYLFATGVRPLAGYPTAGVIWYQGESNAHNIEVHERLFDLLVKSWRREFNDERLPFIMTQLSSIERPSWPAFRESQRRIALNTPDVYMAVSSDLGHPHDVHPRQKKPVGERLARQALHNVYGMAHVTPQGPTPQSVRVDGRALRIEMKYGAGMHASDGKPLGVFEVAEIDGLYHPASAQVVGDNVLLVSSPEVEHPRFVRYGWQPYTESNLVNADGLPASTFKEEADTADETIREEELSGSRHGLSGAFAGIAGGEVIVAGGCNFPAQPLATNSKKHCYSTIYAVREGRYQPVGKLPEPTAYGVTVTLPDGMILAGGNGSKKVFRLTMEEGRAVLEELPELPYALHDAGAAAIGAKIYVAGGYRDSKTPCNTLLVLDTDAAEPQWVELKPFPGNPRVQPVAASGRNARGEECLYLWGGFAPDGERSTLETGGLCYSPSRKKWTTVSAPADEAGEPFSVGGGASAQLPDGRIAVVGGVDKEVFLNALRHPAPDYLRHPAAWYRFNDRVAVYDPAADRWTIARRDRSCARAGASAVATPDGRLLVLGGEIRPRIRTPRITTLNTNEL